VTAESPLLDALVVGAGFAGLSCARRLHAAGLRVQVIEARDRVGGRTMPAQLAGRTVDVGGQWVGAGHERLTRLAADAGRPLIPQYTDGAKLLRLAGRTRRYTGLIPAATPLALAELQVAILRLDALSRRVPAATPWTAAGAAALDAETVDRWQRRWLRTAGGRALFESAVRAVFCADASQLSMLGFLHYLSSNGGFEQLVGTTDAAQAATVDGGLHGLSTALAAPLADTLRLAAPVRLLTQHADRVIATLDDGSGMAARRVVVAMAPLAAGRITLAVPDGSREQLAQRMPMGSVIKCVIAYARPFWRAAGLSGEYVGGGESVLSPVFDASPADAGHGALVGFIDGPNAVRWSGADPALRRAAVLASLAEAFGAQALTPIDYVDQDWVADPWSRGCYVGLPTPGTLSALGPALRRPLGRLHWAGTETAEAWCGYVEGALQSGERAAAEVIAAGG
jgi:monoamine oxidase